MTLKEVIKQLGIKLIGWVKSNCVNNLLSDRTDLPLSAAQGKALDGKITALNSNIKIIRGTNLTKSGETLLSGQSLLGYVPIATFSEAFGQRRSNQFDAALTTNGTSIYVLNAQDSVVGKEWGVVLAKLN